MRISNTILVLVGILAALTIAAFGLTRMGADQGFVLFSLFGAVSVAGTVLAFSLALTSRARSSIIIARGFITAR